jgi:uncharacterized protein (DUF305 family)
MKTWRKLATLLLGAAALAACGTTPPASSPTVVQPGAPGEAGRTLDAGEATAARQRGHTEADVHFMQGMIPHHAQALEMTALVPERTRREDVRLLARRIELSQKDEIALMQRWLAERGEEVPGLDAHHGHADHHGQHGHHGAEGHAMMPGMLTEAEMRTLARASGAEFDRLFLEFMIRHHEGALVMVEELFASGGAGEDGEIFQFAAHVDSDQRIEIARMRRMLTTVGR